MKYWKNGQCYELPDPTPEELAQMEQQERLARIEENRRPFTADEVNAMLITQQINTLTVDDNTALRMIEFYPQWTPNTAYAAGFKLTYKGKLWRVLQAHTSQLSWEPDNAASLWEQIVRGYTGEETDPIPYEGNMRLENGKHYIQNNVIYKCTRDTGNPVYHALKDLIGLYVEEAFKL
jgi:hypothetical protein